MSEILATIVSFLDSLSFLGTSTHFVKVQQFDALLLPVADSLGMELTIIKYTFSLFLVYPFAALLRVAPGASVKHFLSALGGFLLMQW